MKLPELIKHLEGIAEQALREGIVPDDIEVLYRMCSDWSVLEAEMIGLLKAGERRIIYREANGYSDFNTAWVPKGKEVEYNDFRTIVYFPGN